MSEYTKQANDFLKFHDLKFHARKIDYGRYFDGDKESRNIYRLTLTRRGTRIRYSTRFGASLDMTWNNIEPTAYDLLTCITKYDPDTFEDFCSAYGYDTDSRSAERIYRAVCKDWANVQRFFTKAEIEQLAEIN